MTIKKKPFPEKELRSMYETERLTTYQIADQAGVSSTTVGVWLRDYGIPRRPSNNGLLNRGITPPTKEDLERMVHSEHLGYEQIAALFGVDFTAIPYWLKKHGIARPTAWDTRYKGNRPVLPTAEQILSLYSNGTSIAQIADQFDTTSMIVRRLCRDYCILLRRDGWDGGKRHPCKDGHLVRSVYERRVDDWLSERQISHSYEPSLPFCKLSHADFLANGWYIEVWGVKNNQRYNERKAHKTQAYHQYHLPLIELAAHSFNKDQNDLWERRLLTVLTEPPTSL